ncbi:MAG: BatA domain-containing protein, partial [Gluconacetobacter sp.]
MIFQLPWLLAALAILPVLWLLLRTLPPPPQRRAFPAIMLLHGLRARVTQAATAPLWLLLLRCVALAALIVGLAGPVLRQDRAGPPAPPRAGARDHQGRRQPAAPRPPPAPPTRPHAALRGRWGIR